MISPLVAKELSGVARRWQTYAARGLYVGLIAVIVFRFWREANHPGMVFSLSDFAHLGRRLFDLFLPLQMTFVILAAISGASDAISREARIGTLGILLLTSLNPRRIASGKWRAVMAQALSLVLCGVPVLAISAYLGGVGAWEILWSALLTLAAAGVAAALTLNFSATSPSGGRAMFLAIGTFAGCSVAPAIAALFGTPGLALASFLHPVIAAVTAANAITLGPSFRYLWIPSMLVSAALVRILLSTAALRIAARAQRAPRPANPSGRDFATATSYYGRERNGRSLVVKAGVWEDHPLLWKELAARPAARMGADVRVGIVFLFFLFLILFSMAAGGRIESYLMLFGVPGLLLALVNGAALFVHEKEGRKIDLLLSTPLTAWKIVGSKLAAGIVAPESLIVLGLGGLFVAAWCAEASAVEGVMMASTAALGLAFAYVLAATASLHARTLRGAFLSASGMILLLYFGLPWVAELLFGTRTDAGLQDLLQGASPVAFLDALWTRRARHAPAPTGPFFQQCALYGGATALLVGGLVYRLKRIAAVR